MRWLCALALCLASPAKAQTFEDEAWIDYDLLFAQYGDQIVTETDRENGPVAVLHLSGAVRIERQGEMGNYIYRSSDCSTDGGAAMTLALMMTLRDAALQCEGFATPAQVGKMTSIVARIGDYVAQNSVPRQTWATMEPQFRAMIEKEGGLDCKVMMHQQSWSGAFLRAATDARGEAKLTEFLAEPQLPVWGKKQCN